MKLLQVTCCLFLLTIFYVTEISAENGFFGMPNPFGFDMSMSNLGNFINRQVEEQVRHITANVNKHILDMNSGIQKQMQDMGNEMQTQMAGMSSMVNNQIENLGTRINAQVQESLQPLHAMMIQSAMAQGVGGTTVANYGEKITLFLINGVKYSCPGQQVTNDKGMRCSTKLTTFHSGEDGICTESSYSNVNSIFCFGTFASLSCIGESCQCHNGKMYTLDALRSICGDTYGTNQYVKYDYYPDRADQNHIPVPNPNKFVKCYQPNTGHCAWSGNGFVMSNYNNN